MRRLRIGIDPDTDKSGVALINGNKIEVLEIMDLFDTLNFIDQNPEAIIHISAGWLNRVTIFHHAKNTGTALKIAERVGANHEVGKQIEKYCIKAGRDVRLYKPTKKKWNAAFFTMVTKCTKRTNAEMRDAVTAAW